MGITSAIVLYLVIWFMTWLVVIPIRITTQGESGDIVPGTHSGSPQVHHLKKKAWITTGLAAVLWAIIAGIIFSGIIDVRDFDWLNRMGAAE
jgi:predicted secreted protein